MAGSIEEMSNGRPANTEPRRILVVANETIQGAELLGAIRARAPGNGLQVLVVGPALNSRLRHWISDEDRARRDAALRLGACLAQLGRHGIEANGWVGDADPLLSISDALQLYHVDEIVIATHPEHHSNWLTKRVVARARRVFPQPIQHVVVETPAAEAAQAAA
jgi:GABA permease